MSVFEANKLQLVDRLMAELRKHFAVARNTPHRGRQEHRLLTNAGVNDSGSLSHLLQGSIELGEREKQSYTGSLHQTFPTA